MFIDSRFTRILATRETDSNGCIICPPNPSQCPPCEKGQCVLTTQTCESCAVYSCVETETTSGSKSVAAKVGASIGGLLCVALIAAVIWYYKFIYKKNGPVFSDDSDDIMMQSPSKEGEDSLYPLSNMDSKLGDGGKHIPGDSKEAVTSYNQKNKEISKRVNSYESFTKHKKAYPTKTKTAKEIAALQRRERQRQIALEANKNLQSFQGSTDTSTFRESMVTTDSTSNASNILPIAYIPGVTVRPTANNTRSIYSFDSESIFSDLNTIENASIVGDIIRSGNENRMTSNQILAINNPTITAIKSQPKLVAVDKIEEENEDSNDEDADDVDDGDYDGTRAVYSNGSSLKPRQYPKSSNLKSTSFNTTKTRVSNIEEGSEDSDVDSDIENITRAASFRRPKEREILLDVPLEQQQSYSQDTSQPIDSLSTKATLYEIPITIDFDKNDINTLTSFGGSFLFDVEMDQLNGLDSPHPSPLSPFDDPKQ
jgi:hypothetical protein